MPSLKHSIQMPHLLNMLGIEKLSNQNQKLRASSFDLTIPTLPSFVANNKNSEERGQAWP